MPLQIDDRLIERVQIIDDEPSAREAYSFSVEDLDLVPVMADQPQYTDLYRFITMIRSHSHAAICDYHLSTSNYATFDGGATVAALYQQKFPAILCTRYYDAEIDSIRPHRQNIPVLLKPDDLEPETIEDGFRRCIAEFQGHISPTRKPWRTLLRVDSIDSEKGYFYVVIPGWNPKEIVRLRLKDVPETIRTRVQQEQARFHARVNIGAENYEDLFFADWEQQ